MAKKKQEEAPKGSPAWMATFSDLMNLLLCFFVLLFSMSTVDAAKFEMVVASLQSTFSVRSPGSSIGEGELISSGVSQLKDFSMYFEQLSSEETDDTQTEESKQDEGQSVKETYQQEALKESEQMAEQISKEVEKNGIQNQVEVDFNGQYVTASSQARVLRFPIRARFPLRAARSGHGAESRCRAGAAGRGRKE